MNGDPKWVAETDQLNRAFVNGQRLTLRLSSIVCLAASAWMLLWWDFAAASLWSLLPQILLANVGIILSTNVVVNWILTRRRSSHVSRIARTYEVPEAQVAELVLPIGGSSEGTQTRTTRLAKGGAEWLPSLDSACSHHCGLIGAPHCRWFGQPFSRYSLQAYFTTWGGGHRDRMP